MANARKALPHKAHDNAIAPAVDGMRGACRPSREGMGNGVKRLKLSSYEMSVQKYTIFLE